MSIEIERALKKLIQQKQQYGLKLTIHPLLDHYLQGGDEDYLMKLSENLNAQLVIEPDDTLHLNDYQFYSTINGKRIEI